MTGTLPVVRTRALGPLAANAYLFGDPVTHEAVLIDVGQDPELFLRDIDAEGWRVTALLVTHAHFDHIGGLAAAWRATRAPVYVAPEERAWLVSAEDNLSASFAAMIGDAGARVVLPSTLPVTTWQEGDTLRVGRFDLAVLTTPGHTPGSVCLVCRQAGVCFTGDTLFRGTVGRTDLPGGDARRLAASLAHLIEALDADTVLLPGHGAPTRLGDERETNAYLPRRRR